MGLPSVPPSISLILTYPIAAPAFYGGDIVASIRFGEPGRVPYERRAMQGQIRQLRMMIEADL
jgi:hypothetical protein